MTGLEIMKKLPDSDLALYDIQRHELMEDNIDELMMYDEMCPMNFDDEITQCPPIGCDECARNWLLTGGTTA